MSAGYFKSPLIMSVSNEWVLVESGEEVDIILSLTHSHTQTRTHTEFLASCHLLKKHCIF